MAVLPRDTSKTLAKLANHIAKKNPRFNGVRDLASMPQAEMDALLAGIEVGEKSGESRGKSGAWAAASRRICRQPSPEDYAMRL